MGQAFVRHCRSLLQIRSGRVHAEKDINMPASDSGPTVQQQQGTAGSSTSLQRGAAQSTLTHAAAVNGDKSALSKLLNNHHDDINSGDQFGRTPLMLAVLADRLECAELLIKHGAKVNNSDNAGRTALHWAAYKGNLRLCKLLLAKGANWKIKDKEGQSALHLATRHDNTKCLMLLIKQLEPGEQDEQDNAKRTALHWSSSYGNEEAVKLLIKHNSNIGIPDMDGKTPLHWAASAGHNESAVNTVKLILDTEPSVITWQDYEGRTALHLAVAQGNETIAQQLINFQTNLVKCNVSVLDNMFRTPLHWAAVLGHTHIVNLLLDAGANVTSSDANGATPLHYAAQNNHADTVTAFLSRDGITDEPDLEGRTALMWAAGKGADDVIRCMVEISQPDINATDKTGATALHAAAMCGHPSTIQVLIELGANVNILDQSKHTPLFRAAEMGHTSVAKVLVQGGAQGDIVDQEGRSPLHWAALGGHACICAILIGEGLNPNIHDFTGRTPLQCASYGGFTNSILLLLEKGADPNSQDSEGMTALHWCCSSGYLDAAKLLLDHGAFPNHMEYSEDRLTPLDYALLNEHHHVAQYMIEQGALSITGIRDIAAIRVQAYFRGYRVRKTFMERKKLLMKHEQLRKDAAKKKVEMTKKTEIDESSGREEKIVDLDMQTGQEVSEGKPDRMAEGPDGELRREGRRTDRQSETDPESKQPKKLCWEEMQESKTIKHRDEKDGLESKVKVENHLQDHSDSDSGRTSDYTPDEIIQHGQPESEKLECEIYKTYQTKKNKSPTAKKSHVLKGNRPIPTKGSARSEIKMADVSEHKIPQSDTDSGNVNSNNSNSNEPMVQNGRREILDERKDEKEFGNCGESVLKDDFSTCGKDSLTNQERGMLEGRRQSVERERRRLVFWRRKSDSAAIIQRAWRNFKHRQHKSKGGTVHERSSRPHQLSNGQTYPRAHHRTDPRTDPEAQHQKRASSAQQSQLRALKETLLMQHIYGKKQVATQPRHGAQLVRTRPDYQQYIPSAAALSFNFALDQYRPMVRNVKTPTSLQQISHQAKHSPIHQKSSSYADGSVNRGSSRRSSKSARQFSYNHY